MLKSPKASRRGPLSWQGEAPAMFFFFLSLYPSELLTFLLNRWQVSICACVSCLLHGVQWEARPQSLFYITIQIAVCLWTPSRQQPHRDTDRGAPSQTSCNPPVGFLSPFFGVHSPCRPVGVNCFHITTNAINHHHVICVLTRLIRLLKYENKPRILKQDLGFVSITVGSYTLNSSVCSNGGYHKNLRQSEVKHGIALVRCVPTRQQGSSRCVSFGIALVITETGSRHWLMGMEMCFYTWVHTPFSPGSASGWDIWREWEEAW